MRNIYNYFIRLWIILFFFGWLMDVIFERNRTHQERFLTTLVLAAIFGLGSYLYNQYKLNKTEGNSSNL